MIYLDNSATTKPCKAAVQAMHEALENGWFNPSAAYGPAVRAEKRMWEARELLANAVGAKPDWLVFTASGSEADSLAILGTAARFMAASAFCSLRENIRRCCGRKHSWRQWATRWKRSARGRMAW